MIRVKKELEQLGPHEVRVQLAMDMIPPGHKRDVAQTWLLRKAAALAYEADGLKNIFQSAQLAATSRAAEAADRAAVASERQAASAERSARNLLCLAGPAAIRIAPLFETLEAR
jgi:hypothetical protein